MRPNHRILAHRHSRHDRAVAADPAIFLQHHRPGFVIDGRNRINGTMRPDLHIILNRHPVFGINIGKRTDICFVTQFKIIFVLYNPIIFGEFTILNDRIPAFGKPV